MGSRESVLGGGAGSLLREVGREALVVELDGDVDGAAQLLDEALGLGRLLPALPTQGQRKADDDALDLLLACEPFQLSEPIQIGRASCREIV